MRNINIKIILFELAVVCCLLSCKKLVEVDPPKSQIIRETVFSEDASAISALIGIYSLMQESPTFGGGGADGINGLAGLSADELIPTATTPEREQFYTNNLLPTNVNVLSAVWGQGYSYIYYSNMILEGISNSPSLTEETRTTLEGEAKFIRAFCHFYLTNLFGEIPLVISSDYRVNNKIARSNASEVYAQIVKDLKEAADLLKDQYAADQQRIRPNKSTVYALLARVNLYMGNWEEASYYASVLINNPQYSLVGLDSVFLQNNEEAIWQMRPVTNSFTNEALAFANLANFKLNDQIIAQYEADDLRKVNWINSESSGSGLMYFSIKYNDLNGNSEYSTVFRLGEQYLIRAEANLHLNHLELATDDINAIRHRAGLLPVNPATEEDIFDAIVHERRLEFVCEFGHRWFDLKRWHIADDVLKVIKGSGWQITDTLYPIPQAEIIKNRNLTQNLGYR